MGTPCTRNDPNTACTTKYHALGVVGIVSAFNFPVAVWSWNAMLAAVCGDASLWKPSSKTPLSAIAVQHILADVLQDNVDVIPEGLFSLVVGSGRIVGQRLLENKRIPLVSITGSTRVGRHAAQIVAGRFGRTILELGDNNAIIVTPAADMAMAVTAIVFGAVGTAGQRCTSTRAPSSTMPLPSIMTFPRGFRRPSSSTTFARLSGFSPSPDRTAVSPTSISAPPARKSAAPSGEKRNRRWTGVRLRRLERLYAPADHHHQLWSQPAPGTGNRLRYIAAVQKPA